MSSRQWRCLEFELAYLALLTRSGLKPLSRWEKELALRERAILESLGLTVRISRRSVRSERRVEETIFSTEDAYLEKYLGRFEGKPIDKSGETQRLEGLLFGYPPCCVEHFIQNGYVANGLSPDDQKILFHWACPRCQITPFLLPQYRRIYDECCRAFHVEPGTGDTSLLRSHFRRGTVLAASLAMLATGNGPIVPSTSAQPGDSGGPVLVSAPWHGLVDPHWTALPRTVDADQDYLSDDEEIHVGLLPKVADTDSDGVIDGVQLATELWGLVQALPQQVSETGPYRQDVLMWGLETCGTCGQVVNMGFVQITNPLMKLTLDVPFIGLHFMEHGGLFYSGDVHSGRVNIPLLDALLKSKPDVHWLPVDDDTDRDGLADSEEAYLGTDPDHGDQDSDGTYDGVALAVRMSQTIRALPDSQRAAEPYLIEHLQRGIETCDRCGEAVNMGYMEITNPLENLSLEIPCIGLHYLDHGSFTYSGDLHQGRSNVRLLKTILESDGRAHVLSTAGDGDHDGLVDEEETFFGAGPATSDSDHDGVSDGVQLAKKMWSTISRLDTTASQSQPYLVEHEMKGIVMCPVCGLWVNMGYVEIINVPRSVRQEITYLGLHFLERGSFAYGREGQRIKPIETARALSVPIRGDVNDDGVIDVKDVVAMVNYILGLSEPTLAQRWAADINGDGRIDVLDIVQAIRAILG